MFVWNVRIPDSLAPPGHTQSRSFTIALADALRLPWTWLGLGFALIGGAAFNGMFCMPYAVRQAAGSMRRLLQIFIPSLIIFSVLLVVVVSRYGMAGAALLFSVFSIFQVGIATYKTHTDLLPGEHGKWCIEDLGKPLIASVVTAGIGRWIVGEGMIGVKGLIAICLIFLVSFLSAACATATTRQLAREYSRRLVVIWGRSSSTKA